MTVGAAVMKLYSLGVSASVLLSGCAAGLGRSSTDPASALRADFVEGCGGRVDCLAGLLTDSEWRPVARWLDTQEAALREPTAPAGALDRLARVARAVPEVRRRFYYYDALVIPGSPPRADGTLTWLNEHRLSLALQLYRAGLAPWVIVSGAAVHGHHVEAEILAAALRERGVSAEAVVEEPWARHTTENVRYAAIEGLNRGWRRLLVVSDRLQTLLIARFTRGGAYGGPAEPRTHHGLACVQLDLKQCPTGGLGRFGFGRRAPPGSPLCRGQGAGSNDPPKQKLWGAQ